MNRQRNRLSIAVRVALAAGLVAGAGLAQAQQPASSGQQSQPKKLQEVVVTGSLIRRSSIETASPVVRLGPTHIANSGSVTLGHVIQELPSIQGDATNPHNNTNGGGVANPSTEGGDGAARISLRGLGTGRTLMLVDGQRLVNPDINMLPKNMIERVEVLTEGASTTYGSDAIGGVANFILRRNFSGVELDLNDGISSHGDSQRRGFTLTAGHSGDKYSLAGGIAYNKFDPTQATRRSWAGQQLYLSNGKIVPIGSHSYPWGRIQVPPNLLSHFGCSAPADSTYVTLKNGAAGGNGTSLSDYRCFNPLTDTFNFAAFNDLQTGQKREDGFVIGSFNLADNITLFVDAFYNHTHSAGLDAAIPTGVGDGYNIPADASFNPFGVTYSQNAIPGQQATSGFGFSTRFTGAGTRRHYYNTNTGQIITGLRGAFGNSSWLWNLTFDYGHTHREQVDEHELLISGVQTAINNGGNIFNQVNDLDGLAQGVFNPKYRKTNILESVQGTTSGNLWQLPAGTMKLSVGALFRKQSMNFAVPDAAVLNTTTLQCEMSAEGCASNGRGSDNVKEVFAETLIPVISDVPFIHSLKVDLGARTSRFSSNGQTATNKKVAIQWRPVNDLLVRGTISQVFRSPTLDMLFDGPSLSQPNAIDPCVNLTAAELAMHPAACMFVPPGFQPTFEHQVDTLATGAKRTGTTLKPEHGKSIDMGLVYSPNWAPGMNASVDFWHVYLYDTLVPIGLNTVLNSCFANNNSKFCSFITRRDLSTKDPGTLFKVNAPFVNLGSLSTSGIDFTFNYRIPHFDFGSFNPGRFEASLRTSYTSTFKNDPVPGTSPTTEYAGTFSQQFGNIARWRATFTLLWNRGNWGAQWQSRYIGPVTVLDADIVTGANLPVASVVYNSLEVDYRVPVLHTKFSLGADNLMNKQPPLIYQSGQMNTDSLTYNMIGRFYWARATIKF